MLYRNQDLAEEFGLLLSGKMSQFTGYFAMEEVRCTFTFVLELDIDVYFKGRSCTFEAKIELANLLPEQGDRSHTDSDIMFVQMYNQRHAAKEFSIHKLNGSRLAENFANELEEMLKKRKKAVQVRSWPKSLPSFASVIQRNILISL